MNNIYLVTGVAGFIGSHIAEELLKNQYNEVIGIDNFYSGFKDNLDVIDSPNFYFYEGDINDESVLRTVFEKHKIKFVFHQAAVSSVQKSINDPLISNMVNVRGTLTLLDFARIYNIRRFVFASSAAIYGDEPTLPKSEQSVIQPISPYGYEKLMSEQYLKLYLNLFQVETIALRYFNVYGPRQDPSSEYSGVISIFEDKFSNNECPIIFGDGMNYRDFIHVKDIVKVNLCAMHQPYNPNRIEFCCGTGVKKTINELFNIFCKKYNKDWKPIYKAGREGDISGSISDNSLMKSLIGKDRLIDFEDGVLSL